MRKPARSACARRPPGRQRTSRLRDSAGHGQRRRPLGGGGALGGAEADVEGGVQRPERGAEVGDDASVTDTIADLARVVVELHDGNIGPERRAGRVKSHVEDVGAAMTMQSPARVISDVGREGKRPPRTADGPPESSRAVDRLAVTPAPSSSASACSLGARAGPAHAVAGHDQAPSPPPAAGRRADRLAPRLGSRAHRRRRLAGGVGRLGHQVHRQREEHRSRRRRQGERDGAAERGRSLGGRADLVRPLRELLGHLHHVAGKDRIAEQESGVLLAGRDEQRRARAARVVENRQARSTTPCATGVHDAEASARLRVPVGCATAVAS